MLSDFEDKWLKELSADRGLSCAAIVREGIRGQYAMTIQGKPCCATGQRCYVPQMHPPDHTPANQVHPPEPTKTNV